MRSVAKPALAAVVALLAVVVLAACGSSSSSSSASGGSSASAGSSTSSSSSSGSSGSSSQPGKGKPPIVLGDKNFTEEFILGDLYQQALQAKGYTVTLKANIGSSELTDKALTSGQIQMYPEYTGVILSVIKGQSKVPVSAAATYAQAKAFEAGRGYTLLNPTPFQDRDVTITLKAFAQKNHLVSMEDLAKLPSWTNGGPPENKTRYEGLVGMHEAYHLNNVHFVPLAIGLQYQALDSGKVDSANVFTTDGQLSSGKYALLTDPKHIYGFQQVAPVVKTSLLQQEGPAFAQTLNAVDSKLTDTVMQKLNAAVVLQKVDAATVAKEFLKANNLL
jgi:osmoprotectant transport system substrate-binding protein